VTGADLKAWRESVGWTQGDLMVELEIRSRQTIGTWESAEKIPRLVELAIVALDQIEASRKRSGFEKQFTPETIAAHGMKYWHQVKAESDE
jgi:transcriptional regulator with XRE-family HTH domain